MAQQKLIKRFVSNPLVQTFLIYVSGGWIVLEMTDYFINNYGLGEIYRDVLLIILIVGLPVALILSWYFRRDKAAAGKEIIEQGAETKTSGVFEVMLKKPWFSIPGTVLFLLIILSLIRLVYRYSSDPANRMDQARSEISMAVLPFINYTGDPDQEWLVDGQQDALIHELCILSQFRPIRVLPRTTINAFKNQDKPVAEIAREIDVEYLVEASVMHFGDDIILQLRLIDVYPEEIVVWAESCSSEFKGILRLHRDIAHEIAEKMNLQMSPEEWDQLPAARQVNLEAYKAYLRGMYEINKLTPESRDKGLEFLHEAVSIDPGEAFAHAALALGYCEIAHSPLDPGDALVKAEAAALQALKLDPNMAEVHQALGEVYLYKTWEFDRAREELEKALEINPNLAAAHYHYSWGLYLWGEMEKAIEEHKLAKHYDPFNPINTAWLGGLYYYDGQYEKAIETALESFDIQEDNLVGIDILARAYLALGRTEEAIETHEKLVELYPFTKGRLGCTYASTGHIEEAEKIIKELEEADVNGFIAWQLAKIYSALDKKDEAFRWLAFEPPTFAFPWIIVIPDFQNLHDDPRFTDLVDRFDLPD